MNAVPQGSSPPRLAGSRVVVVGAQKSGLAMARFLLSRQAMVVLTDVRPLEALGPDAEPLRRGGVTLQTGGHETRSFVEADLIAVSPGVPLTIAPIAEAHRHGVRVVGEIELASWFLQGIVIGITGTNGKSTTTALAAHLLSHGGLKAVACGNIGLPLTDLKIGRASCRERVWVE